MDFLSRDRYRQAVEELARADRRGPGARGAAERRERTARRPSGSRPRIARAHVGYHLIGQGPAGISRRTSPTSRTFGGPAAALPHAHATVGLPRCHRARHGTARCAHRCATRGACGGDVWWRWRHGAAPPASGSELAIALVQRLAVAPSGPPRRLPRLEFAERRPAEARTMVVIPTLLTSVAGVAELLEHLEVLALGNSDPQRPFRHPERLRRRAGGRDAGGRRDSRAASGGHRGAERACRARTRRQLPPLPSRTAVERERRVVDGLGAQARQARGVQPPAARRHRHQLHRACGRPGAPRAGVRYASRSTATPGCRATRRAS